MAKKEKRGRQGEGGGRKWFDGKTEEVVLTKLEEIWALGGSDAEAAFFADVSTASLSRYLSAHPKVSERKAALKENPVLQARRAVIEAFADRSVVVLDRNGKEHTITAPKDADLALKYLERKRKDEFSERKEVVLDDSKRVEWAQGALNDPKMAAEITAIMEKLTKK